MIQTYGYCSSEVQLVKEVTDAFKWSVAIECRIVAEIFKVVYFLSC